MCGIHLVLSSPFHLPRHTLSDADLSSLKARGPDWQGVERIEYEWNEGIDGVESESFVATMAAGVLALRGESVFQQPVRNESVGFGWNGEVRHERHVGLTSARVKQ